MKFLFFACALLSCYAVSHCQTFPALILFQPSILPDSTPVPVQNLSIAIKDNTKGLLRWKSDELPAESFFAVERSNNGTDFNIVGIIRNNAMGSYEFLDDAPSKGKIYYRVRLTASTNTAYSNIVSTTVSADISCKFYPNPVDKALIIRSESAVELQITDRFGKMLITDHLQAGLKVVDVSSLEPGIYVITLFQKETNRLITEKLVKK
jgi:Secretion system C-terminal sorting domain